MARTVNEIFNIMKAEALAKATEANNTNAIAMFNNTSKVAIWRIIFYAIAFCHYTLEVIWDNTVIKIQQMLSLLMPHTPRWYRQKVLSFQYGFNLITDSDKFDNTGYTNEQIEASKIVAFASVNEATIDNIRSLLIKVAKKDGNGNPEQLSNSEEAALTAYVQEIKDAGVRVIIYNRPSDYIRATLNVYYNPLLLDSNGNRLDGIAGKSIEDVAKEFPFNLDFNGEFIVAQFIDALQSAYGVGRRRVDLVSIEKKTGAGAYTSIASSFVPEAGYAKFDVDGLTINYLPDVSA